MVSRYLESPQPVYRALVQPPSGTVAACESALFAWRILREEGGTPSTGRAAAYVALCRLTVGKPEFTVPSKLERKIDEETKVTCDHCDYLREIHSPRWSDAWAPYSDAGNRVTDTL